MGDASTDLRTAVERATAALRRISEEESARRPAPGKWSPREILGHLVDSACNNHQRFVRAQLQDDLVFQGYDQEAWVAVQRYQEAPWMDLIDLWRSYNLHLARMMSVIPEEVLRKPRLRHNLHQLAWKTVPEGEATTLDYFLRDYVGHLENHLKQILGSEAASGEAGS